MKAFHSFRLDPLNQCLWRGDQRVMMTPKAFDLLRYLVEHPGRLVTHEEILDALWPKAHVNPEVVKKYVLAIRKVLGDPRHEPVFIETLPRRGYQFIAPVVDEAGAGSRAIPASRIVGRDAALEKLDVHLDKAVHGQRQVVFVTGEPGIGKTALVDAFQQRATQHPGLRIARGQCVEGFGGKEAYYPMLEALGQLARDPGGGPILQILAARAPTWLVQFPSLVKATQREALQREILGATRERMLREICEALDALTHANPLMLVFEDLQWVDPSTLDLIAALARRRDAARLLVLATYRPLDVVLAQSPLKSLKRELQLHDFCEEIGLERLSMDDVVAYVEARLAGDAAQAGLAEFIHRRCAGNPLFMVALLQDLQEKGWKIDSGIPETLQQMLDLQFDQLNAAEQHVLTSASVAGGRFSVWLIASPLDLPGDQVEGLCEALADRQQLIKAAGIEEVARGIFSPCYEFTHSLYREGIYRRLSDAVRSRLHRKIAGQLESGDGPGDAAPELAGELARHLEQGHEYPRAVHYLIKAAEAAGRRFAYRESIRILQHALELAPRIPGSEGVQCRIHEFIGDAHFALGTMAESARSYQDSASLAAAAGLGAAQVSALSAMVRPLGLIDPDRGIEAIDQAAQVSDALDDPRLAASTRMLAAAIRLLYDEWRNEDAVACAASYEAMRRLGEADPPSYHEMIYAHVRVLQGHYGEAMALFTRCASGLDAPANLITHFFALSGKTVALLRSGNLGEVLRIVREGKATAAKNGNDPWLFNFREAWLHLLAMDFEGARRLCETMIRSGPEYTTEQPQAIARICEGYAELHRGNGAAAIERFGEAAEVRTRGKFFLHEFWRLVAQLGLCDAWLASADLANAGDSSEAFLHKALATEDPYMRALAWDRRARYALLAKDWQVARECLDHALSILREFEIPMAAWQVHATAREWNLHAGLDRAADEHRAAAARHIFTIADSFAPDEALRASFLAALPVRHVCGEPSAQLTQKEASP